jgi:hypothetical protein
MSDAPSYTAPSIQLTRIAPGEREATRVALMSNELEFAAHRLQDALTSALGRFAPDAVISTLTGLRQLGHTEVAHLRTRLSEAAEMAETAQQGDRPPFDLWRLLNDHVEGDLKMITELATAAAKVEEMALIAPGAPMSATPAG